MLKNEILETHRKFPELKTFISSTPNFSSRLFFQDARSNASLYGNFIAKCPKNVSKRFKFVAIFLKDIAIHQR